jgi:hypothetical protein
LRYIKLLLVFLLVTLISMLLAPTRTYLPAQAAVSGGSLIARGYLSWDRIAAMDGESREFRVVMVVPKGVIVATGTVSGGGTTRVTMRISTLRSDQFLHPIQPCWSVPGASSFSVWQLNPALEFQTPDTAGSYAVRTPLILL